MTDGEAWLEALGEQLRESEKQIPALAAAQVKLADADATGVAELQQEAGGSDSRSGSSGRRRRAGRPCMVGGQAIV